MATSSNLRLQVILQAIDKATAPLRGISSSSSKAAQAIKATRDVMKDLNKVQGDVQGYRQSVIAARAQQRALSELQAKTKKYTEALDAQRATHQNVKGNLKAARHEYDTLARALQDGTGKGEQFSRQMELARIRLLSAQQATERSLASLNNYKARIKNVADETSKLQARQAQTQAQLEGYKRRLDAAGVSTSGLGKQARELRAQEQRLTETLAEQQKRMEALAATQKRLTAARAAYDAQQRLAGKLTGAGVATGAAGAAMGVPVAASVRSFADLETASTQLRVAMMGADGRVSDEFERINSLAIKLGDRLPGTTAEFIDMMTMLRRQGVSGKAILGGVGEAAAYLGVQLRMSMAEAAEFAAKIQDATRTPEGDMLSLLDQIQRANSLGVDRNNMLQAVTKMGPALAIVRKEGLAAMQELMPLAVMMDQTGMAGEAAGNAIRKVLQFSVDADKRDKANKALKEAKAGFTLDLSDGKGEFGGMDKLFKQLGRLQALNTEQRLNVIKALFGDDSETLQVVNTLMSKGVDGYREVAQKLQQQADLRMRVNEQLGTLTNLWESAQGSFTNLLAQVGATLAPELKQLVERLSEITSSVGAWVRENPALVATLAKSAAVVSMLLLGMGSLTMALAALVGPLAVIRYGLALFGIQGAAALPIIKTLGTGLAWLGRMAFLNPFGATIMGLTVLGTVIYRNWDSIWAFLDRLPSRFSALGSDMMQGLINGVSRRFEAVRDTVREVADAAVGMFKDTLGIRSPSRVFALAGGEISAGAAQGILERQALVRRAALAMAASATAVFPLAAPAAQAQLARLPALQAQQLPVVDMSGGLRIDRRPPLSASVAAAPAQPPVVAGDMHFHIHPSPGMDERALARLVAQEVARLKRQEGARRRSSLHDLD